MPKRNKLPAWIAAAIEKVGRRKTRRSTTRRNPQRLGIKDPAVRAAIRDAIAWSEGRGH